MQWASAVSDKASLDEAFAACLEAIAPSLEEGPPDLALVFLSPHFAADYKRVPGLLKEQLRPGLILGCSAGGVIGGGHEVEYRPGFSLTVAWMPDVRLTPFHIQDERLPSPDAAPEEWETLVHVSRAWEPHFVVLADPFTLRAEEFLTGMDYAFPRGAKIGGLASGGDRRGLNVLYLGEDTCREGAVGVALSGNIVVDTVVAQGCRPIGHPMRITKCRENRLLEMDGQPPLQVLQQLYETLSGGDRQLFQHSLFLGLVMDELQEEHRLGDFLIRNLLGFDRESSALIIGERLQENQTIQFHLRDAGTASDDLREMLAHYLADRDSAAAEGALLFSCLGRGSSLFGRPDHDTDLFREALGPLPLGGFFCNGEIGQVGRVTYLHGYTSSFGIFRRRWPE